MYYTCIYMCTYIFSHVVGVCDDVVDKLISSAPLNHNRSGASWVSVTIYAYSEPYVTSSRQLSSDRWLVSPHHDIFVHELCVCVLMQGDAKLHNYGLYYMTECGKAVKFPIGYTHMYI